MEVEAQGVLVFTITEVQKHKHFLAFRKVINWMEQLEKEFETVTKLLIDSNLPTFLADMTHYLSDLRYTKGDVHIQSN